MVKVTPCEMVPTSAPGGLLAMISFLWAADPEGNFGQALEV